MRYSSNYSQSEFFENDNTKRVFSFVLLKLGLFLFKDYNILYTKQKNQHYDLFTSIKTEKNIFLIRFI